MPSPRADAELLLAHVLGVARGRAQVFALTGATLPFETVERFDALVLRRGTREPLQHITGLAHFRGIDLAVGPGVFVPRPETETVAGLAIDALPPGPARVVDLGTGSGAIALAIAAECPDAEVVGVERSPDAFAWATRNLARLGLANARIVLGDLADAVPEWDGSVDVVVSNPPYIPDGMVPRDLEVQRFDPAGALYGGADGLDPMRAVITTAARLLRPGGTLVVEHGELQGPEVRALLVPSRWTAPFTHPDPTSRPRATTARRPSNIRGSGAA